MWDVWDVMCMCGMVHACGVKGMHVIMCRGVYVCLCV